MNPFPCPCGLTQQQLEKYNKVDDELRCTAEYADETTESGGGNILICRKPLGAHPSAPQPGRIFSSSSHCFLTSFHSCSNSSLFFLVYNS